MVETTRDCGLPAARHEGAPTYIDVFAGCGGLSLGLHRAGWRGLFAVEKDAFAFQTLSANFLSPGSLFPFDWPDWLPKAPTTVEDLLRNHKEELALLLGKVDMLAGGPPCQGFSSAGRRMADDPRNSLIERYLELVELLQPRILLLENVRGFTLDFKARPGKGSVQRENAAAQLQRRLLASYDVETRILLASDFGVPQKRPRFILVAVRKGSGALPGALDDLGTTAATVAQRYGIGLRNTAADAISDLEVARNEIIDCLDSRGFEAIGYKKPVTAFQRAMRDGRNVGPSDTRLAKHTQSVRERFANIIEVCRSEGRSTKQLSTEIRERFGIKKLTTRVLDPNQPAPTVTSMPDDLLHYREPRTLTVRETARLQSFPDWFAFHGKYTTGGHRRRTEVPRFTQVANAVPPLLAEILGTRIMEHCLSLHHPIREVG